jgi:hypothetical protein
VEKRERKRKKKEVGAKMIFYRSSLSSNVGNKYFIGRGVYGQI